MSWAPSFYQNKSWKTSPAQRDASTRRGEYNSLKKQGKRQKDLQTLDAEAHSDDGSINALKEKIRKPKESRWRRLFGRRRRR
jgi:hypothetical protein